MTETIPIDIREFLRERALDLEDLTDALELHALISAHMPESVMSFNPKDKTGSRHTQCEICGPLPTIDTAWPCEPLRRRAADFRDHRDYDADWDRE